jgi:hypothetical protein
MCECRARGSTERELQTLNGRTPGLSPSAGHGGSHRSQSGPRHQPRATTRTGSAWPATGLLKFCGALKDLQEYRYTFSVRRSSSLYGSQYVVPTA